ncbi:class I SAM-dependent methyltransferase [Methylocapsa acidiphila]|uniref:class I SAM-dependent methyltransferase n=1 Tax=Methylocapsa acidiphila TaxID=133552 RepID=UPI00041F34F6|nr:class I SAM-dependent methyltransferase [Methylocapsa acidiphila]
MSVSLQAYEQQNEVQVISEEDGFTVERYGQFYRLLPSGAEKLLDIGCNTGRGGEALKALDNRLQIVGIDCVHERLERLPKAYSEKIYGLATDMPIEDRSFDVVVAGEFLEHLYPSDVDKTLCEIQRILKIGGRVLLTTPNPHYLRNKIYNYSVYGPGHLTQHFPKILRLRMQMHGFSNVRIFGSGRASRYVGRYFPLFSIYGSYMISADKY